MACVWTQRPPSRIAAIGFVPPTAAMETYCGLPGTPSSGTLGTPTSRIPVKLLFGEFVEHAPHERFGFHVELPDIREDIPAPFPHHVVTEVIFWEMSTCSGSMVVYS